jgi:hypothetical protein
VLTSGILWPIPLTHPEEAAQEIIPYLERESFIGPNEGLA